MKHICSTCGFNSGLTSPPSPGGPRDGVYCTNPNMAYSDDDKEDFEEHNNLNLWRIEIVAPGEECSGWTPQEERVTA